VQILQQYGWRIGREANFLRFQRIGLILTFGVAAMLATSACKGQQNAPQVPTKPLVVPNRTMDNQELNELAEKNVRKENFEAANVARKQAIEDETNKLLILARDLKAKTDNLGAGPLPPMLVREAAVIELLANDVKEKMKLTVNSN